MSEYYTPNAQEFLAGAKQEFVYLITDFGFSFGKAPFEYENQYSAFFRKVRVFVYIEGLSYGISLSVSLGRLTFFGRVREQISLHTLIALRKADLLEPRCPEKRGQLQHMKFGAAALRHCAADFLAGDFSAAPEALQLELKLRRDAEEAYEKAANERTFMQAADAFHRGQFELAVRLLESRPGKLGKVQQTMLKLARKRIAADSS